MSQGRKRVLLVSQNVRIDKKNLLNYCVDVVVSIDGELFSKKITAPIVEIEAVFMTEELRAAIFSAFGQADN